MNGNNVLLDSNIILYLLNGDRVLSELLYRKKLYISFVSQLELPGYKGITHKDQVAISKFFKECIVIDINEEIKREVISIRRGYKLKLPDSIILATARFLNIPLITADIEFKQIGTNEIIIYE